METENSTNDSQNSTKSSKKDLRYYTRFFALFFAVVSLLVMLFALLPKDFFSIIKNDPRTMLLLSGAPSIAICLKIFFSLQPKDEKKSSGKNFLDIDKEQLSEFTNAMAKFMPVDRDDNVKLLKEIADESLSEKITELKSFQKYFNAIRFTLMEQIKNSDKKASMLLDKGTIYARNGIIFYICCIIILQIITWDKDIKTNHVYGMVSCSLVFIFIEFLSAWFLKQYRQYVDTSTYIIKIKSILERYMLAYLVIQDSQKDDPDYSDVISMLKEDIKWPETYLTKNPDVSFAKECMETATQLIRSIKPETKKD